MCPLCVRPLVLVVVCAMVAAMVHGAVQGNALPGVESGRNQEPPVATASNPQQKDSAAAVPARVPRISVTVNLPAHPQQRSSSSHNNHVNPPARSAAARDRLITAQPVSSAMVPPPSSSSSDDPQTEGASNVNHFPLPIFGPFPMNPFLLPGRRGGNYFYGNRRNRRLLPRRRMNRRRGWNPWRRPEQSFNGIAKRARRTFRRTPFNRRDRRRRNFRRREQRRSWNMPVPQFPSSTYRSQYGPRQARSSLSSSSSRNFRSQYDPTQAQASLSSRTSRAPTLAGRQRGAASTSGTTKSALPGRRRTEPLAAEGLTYLEKKFGVPEPVSPPRAIRLQSADGRSKITDDESKDISPPRPDSVSGIDSGSGGQPTHGPSDLSMDDVISSAYVRKGVNSYPLLSLRFDQDGYILTSLDMKLSRLQYSFLQRGTMKRKKRKVMASNRWPGAVIPYEIVPRNFGQADLDLIHWAMNQWESNTCLVFRPAMAFDKNRLVFQDGTGCSSNVGMIGGRQIITLQQFCKQPKVLLHELGHAIGLIHEHQRPDRDSYLVINYHNIRPDGRKDYHKFSSFAIASLGIPYDYTSIMHYGPSAFSLAPGLPTMQTLQPGYQAVIGKVNTLSPRDTAAVNKMYNCGRQSRKSSAKRLRAPVPAAYSEPSGKGSTPSQAGDASSTLSLMGTNISDLPPLSQPLPQSRTSLLPEDSRRSRARPVAPAPTKAVVDHVPSLPPAQQLQRPSQEPQPPRLRTVLKIDVQHDVLPATGGSSASSPGAAGESVKYVFRGGAPISQGGPSPALPRLPQVQIQPPLAISQPGSTRVENPGTQIGLAAGGTLSVHGRQAIASTTAGLGELQASRDLGEIVSLQATGLSGSNNASVSDSNNTLDATAQQSSSAQRDWSSARSGTVSRKSAVNAANISGILTSKPETLGQTGNGTDMARERTTQESSTSQTTTQLTPAHATHPSHTLY